MPDEIIDEVARLADKQAASRLVKPSVVEHEPVADAPSEDGDE